MIRFFAIFIFLHDSAYILSEPKLCEPVCDRSLYLVLMILRVRAGDGKALCDRAVGILGSEAAVKAAEATKAGQSIFEYDRSSRPAKAYEELTKEVMRLAEREKCRDEAAIAR